MRFELDHTDPDHDAIERLWERLAAVGHISDVITHAESLLAGDGRALDHQTQRQLTPQIVLGAMRHAVHEMSHDGQTPDDYTPGEALQHVLQSMQASAFSAVLKHRRNQPPRNPGNHSL